MNMYLIAGHSVSNIEQAERYYHFTAFLFLNSPKHHQWLMPSFLCQVPLSLAKWLRENEALDSIPPTNIQGPQIMSTSNSDTHLNLVNNYFPHCLCYWN